MREYKDVRKELKKMMDSHGVQFNMAVTYLMDVGWNNIEEIDEVEFYANHVKEYNEIKARGNIAMATPDFMLEMLQLAKEISKITSPWNLLTFAKDCIPLWTGKMELDRACSIADNLIFMVLEENMYDWSEDPEEFREHVMDYCDMVEDEWEQITGETIENNEE